jgi:hypothetical protein
MIQTIPQVHDAKLVALLTGALLLSGCPKTETENVSVGPEEPARRAAQSFVHCIEQEGGGCVAPDDKQGAWDAFALLQWLGGGSPTSILQALQRELAHHRDPLAVEDRFVMLAARYREPLRGAECEPVEASPVTDLMPKLRARVEGRLQGIGLWREDMQGLVDALSREAQRGLEGGWLVHMRCENEPFDIWVATAVHDERQVVVGMQTQVPTWLGGSELDEDQLETRIRSRTLGTTTTLGVIREGTVDSTWLPIAIEEF